MNWQVVASHDSRGVEIPGKWEIADETGELITADVGLLEEYTALMIVNAHNKGRQVSC